jgi:hypothetical protein
LFVGYGLFGIAADFSLDEARFYETLDDVRLGKRLLSTQGEKLRCLLRLGKRDDIAIDDRDDPIHDLGSSQGSVEKNRHRDERQPSGSLETT